MLKIALKPGLCLHALLIMNTLKYGFAKLQLHWYVKQTVPLLLFAILLMDRLCCMYLQAKEVAESDLDIQNLYNFCPPFLHVAAALTCGDLFFHPGTGLSTSSRCRLWQ